MFENMTEEELKTLFDKIFIEYHERQRKFREEGKDIEPSDIQAGSPEWIERNKQAIEIVRLSGLLSDISKRLREIRKEKKVQ